MIITVRDDLTSNVTTADGLLECELPNYNPETMVPFADAEQIEQFANSIGGNPNYFSPKRTDEEKQATKNALAIANNSARAKQDLLATDWCENASVRNTMLTPHLSNAAEFDTYRSALRGIIVNKTIQVDAWPTAPAAVWSSAAE